MIKRVDSLKKQNDETNNNNIQQQTNQNEKEKENEKINAALENGNFSNAENFNLEIEAYAKNSFFEDVKKLPAKIKLIIFAFNNMNQQLSFVIKDPFQNIIFNLNGKNDAIFIMDLNVEGIYKIEIENNIVKIIKASSINISFKFYIDYINIDPLVEIEEEFESGTNYLNDTEIELNKLDNLINNILIEQTFFEARKSIYQEQIILIKNRSLLIAFISTISVVLLSSWQLCYIKQTLEYRAPLKYGF